MQRTARPSADRFAFGANWRNFVDDIDEQRIEAAESSLRAMLGVDDLRGRSFLDVGCGSGLFSLAAQRLGALQVHSFDFDEQSVEATRALQHTYGSGVEWTIEQGDIADGEYANRLGEFDVVYAWGVLHHTGALWQALEHTLGRVAPGGKLFVSVYNDQGRKSRWWRAVKRRYNRLPPSLQAPYAVAAMLPLELRMAAGALTRGEPSSYIRSWTDPRERGMSRWHDLLDWVGGYPFEVARPEEVFRFCQERGFELVELSTCGGGLGCNEFVFRRAG